MKESTKQILAMPSSMTCREVADKLGLSYNQVAQVRKHYNIEHAKKSQGRVTDYKLLYAKIEDGVPYPQIAALFGLKPQSIRHHAAKIGHSRQFTNKDAAIIADYQKRMSIKKIQCRNDCSHDAIYRALKRHGVTPHRKAA